MVKLQKPLEHDSKTITEIDLRGVASLTGKHMRMCAREAQLANGGRPVAILRADPEFQLQVAAAATGMPVETLTKLAAADFLEVLSETQGFLLNLESEKTPPAPSAS